MNITEIANNLINELGAQKKKALEDSILTEGAIQGINLYYNKIKEVEENEQNNKLTAKAKGKKAKK